MPQDWKELLQDRFGDALASLPEEPQPEVVAPRLKKQRLKLDQKKAGLEAKADDETTGVVLLPAIDDSEPEEVVVQ